MRNTKRELRNIIISGFHEPVKFSIIIIIIIIIITIIIFINCTWLFTKWEWLLHMYKNMEEKVTRKFKSGGLHERHVVATWKLGNHLNIRL